MQMTHAGQPVYINPRGPRQRHISAAAVAAAATLPAMNTLIVLSAILAVAVAKPGYLGAAPAAVVAPAAYAAPAVVAAPVHAGYAAYGPAPVVVRSDGYLADTPDVAVTKAAHLTAVAQTQARDAVVNGAAALAAHAAHAYAAHAYAAPAYAAHAYAAPAVAYAAPAPLAYTASGALAAAAHLHAKAALLG
ncbi:cuticle protein 38-like [Schistocerca piceifrons]|uniref:cuticle protein 38-like n=1 Tax=Schistocerca piceifrons TaxID=274613 RepID=UPI001F5E9ECE|nr:cuticle protein 38-like [Schistocerca piceifrons]